MRLARRVMEVEDSVTLAITAKAKKMAKEGRDVVSFGAGEPDYDTPKNVKAAAIKSIESGFTKYTPSSGMPDLKEAISRKLKAENGLDYAAGQIVVSNGAKHSLANIFQVLCEAGDEVLIPAPYWLSYPEMVKLAEAKPVYVRTDKASGFKMTEKGLGAAITKKTRCLILNSPSNPTGCVYNPDELRFIARLAVEHGFFVVSDEIYEKLVYGGVRHVSIASLGKDINDLTITVNGVSKSYSMTGWRIGYAAGPAPVMKAIASLQSHATSNPASISQKAALEAMTGDQSFVEQMRREFEARRDLMVSLVSSTGRISCIKPDGAFYVFCDISKLGLGSVAFANRLLEEALVAVVPGAPFGADDHVRLSFATSKENIEKGLARIGDWVKRNG